MHRIHWCFLFLVLLATVSCSNSDKERFTEFNFDECGIESFKLFVEANKDILLTDITANISGNEIDIYIPYVCDVSYVIPEIRLVDKDAYVIENVEAGMNLIERQEITVVHPMGSNKTYTINTKVFTGLPIVKIETENRFISPDKNIYVNGTINISKTNEFPDGFSALTQIKGRGNATWGYPKNRIESSLIRKLLFLI